MLLHCNMLWQQRRMTNTLSGCKMSNVEREQEKHTVIANNTEGKNMKTKPWIWCRRHLSQASIVSFVFPSDKRNCIDSKAMHSSRWAKTKYYIAFDRNKFTRDYTSNWNNIRLLMFFSVTKQKYLFSNLGLNKCRCHSSRAINCVVHNIYSSLNGTNARRTAMHSQAHSIQSQQIKKNRISFVFSHFSFILNMLMVLKTELNATIIEHVNISWNDLTRTRVQNRIFFMVFMSKFFFIYFFPNFLLFFYNIKWYFCLIPLSFTHCTSFAFLFSCFHFVLKKFFFM